MIYPPDEMKKFLDEKVLFYNQPSFVENDPISIPRQFSRKEDIEISGFFAAIFAWGQRVTIINKSRELMMRMDNSPFEYVCNAPEREIESLSTFIHRTFRGEDCKFFVHSLQQIYRVHGGLETVFTDGYSQDHSIKAAISNFRRVFFHIDHLHRTRKHVPDPQAGSAAKRMNMFMRWMVRDDNKGVDFGIWKNISPADLICPVDLHSGKVARQLGLLERKQDDWKAAEELTANLRIFDPYDPVKYDFALFGTGINEKQFLN
jgi:uncharacterized protein (TIGR02757 family)